MKYIKGLTIEETPITTQVGDQTIELTDEQLRSLGYTPLTEVILSQAEILSGMAPNAETIRQRVADSLVVNVQQLPYMIGFAWQTTIVDNEIRFKLVPDQNGLGTKNNPIIFVEYVTLVPNAHYLYEGNFYKWKGVKTTAGDWDSIEDNMEKIG